MANHDSCRLNDNNCTSAPPVFYSTMQIGLAARGFLAKKQATGKGAEMSLAMTQFWNTEMPKAGKKKGLRRNDIHKNHNNLLSRS